MFFTQECQKMFHARLRTADFLVDIFWSIGNPILAMSLCDLEKGFVSSTRECQAVRENKNIRTIWFSDNPIFRKNVRNYFLRNLTVFVLNSPFCPKYNCFLVHTTGFPRKMSTLRLAKFDPGELYFNTICFSKRKHDKARKKVTSDRYVTLIGSIRVPHLWF